MNFSIGLVAWTAVLAWLSLKLYTLFYNLFLHPLRAYPGPLGGRATSWWKTYIEVVKKESFAHLLMKLHKQYGDVVRVSPNELHFSNPAAYHDIYNSRVRWEKEKQLYTSFGEDHSSFGFLTYEEAKLRKDVMQPLFSRRAIIDMQGLVRQNIDHLVRVLSEKNSRGESSDLLFAFRCFTMDMVTTFCFAKSVNAMDAPDFKAPIVEAMHVSSGTFVMLKNFPLFRKTLFSLPPWLAIKASPETAGLTRLQMILGKQVRDVIANPDSLKDAPHQIIYHRLLDKEAHSGRPVPDATSLYEEAQALMFGGGDSVANTLMVGFFHILDQPQLYKRLQGEVFTHWPNISNPPSFEALERLPILSAAIKESLRVAPGVPSPLLRMVPPSGATIGGKQIPGGAAVGMSMVFVHQSAEIFENPEVFDVDRWTGGAKAEGLDQWLVAFSKGPRSCLGINLARCELYLAFATMLRRFEMKLDGTKAKDLEWRDTFLPEFHGRHLQAWCRPLEA